MKIETLNNIIKLSQNGKVTIENYRDVYYVHWIYSFNGRDLWTFGETLEGAMKDLTSIATDYLARF